jgi:hypothetical protein
MSAAAALRKTICGLDSALRDAHAALAAIENENAPLERTVELGAAVSITRLSSSQLYRVAKRFNLGFQLPSGAWRFYEQRLRAYMAPRGEIGERYGEIGEAQGIPQTPNQAHLSNSKARKSA